MALISKSLLQLVLVSSDRSIRSLVPIQSSQLTENHNGNDLNAPNLQLQTLVWKPMDDIIIKNPLLKQVYFSWVTYIFINDMLNVFINEMYSIYEITVEIYNPAVLKSRFLPWLNF